MHDPRLDIGKTLGSREWLALPEFAIACIEARIDPDTSVSRLHAVDVHPVGLYDGPGLGFRIRPIRGDGRTFVHAVAVLAPGGGAGVVRTLVTLGSATWPLDLEPVAEEPEGFPMVLGAAAIGFAVDRDRAFLAGPPALAFRPPGPRRLRAEPLRPNAG